MRTRGWGGSIIRDPRVFYEVKLYETINNE